MYMISYNYYNVKLTGYNKHLNILTVNKDVTSDDGVRRLLKQVETQFGDCLIPATSLSKNMIIGKGALSDYLLTYSNKTFKHQCIHFKIDTYQSPKLSCETSELL